MEIWAVANQKGGVGKTTTVVSCAGLLAESGKRVLMVDLDPQGSLTCYFRHDPATLAHGTYELFREHRLPPPLVLKAMFLPTSHPGLQLFPAGPGLATVERQFRAEEGVGLRLARALASLRGSFDYVLIDTPPVLGVLMINALAASQRLLLPVQTDYLAIKGLERMAHTLAMVVRARGRERRLDGRADHVRRRQRGRGQRPARPVARLRGARRRHRDTARQHLPRGEPAAARCPRRSRPAAAGYVPTARCSPASGRWRSRSRNAASVPPPESVTRLLPRAWHACC